MLIRTKETTTYICMIMLKTLVGDHSIEHENEDIQQFDVKGRNMASSPFAVNSGRIRFPNSPRFQIEASLHPMLSEKQNQQEETHKAESVKDLVKKLLVSELEYIRMIEGGVASYQISLKSPQVKHDISVKQLSVQKDAINSLAKISQFHKIELLPGLIKALNHNQLNSLNLTVWMLEITNSMAKRYVHHHVEYKSHVEIDFGREGGLSTLLEKPLERLSEYLNVLIVLEKNSEDIENKAMINEQLDRLTCLQDKASLAIHLTKLRGIPRAISPWALGQLVAMEKASVFGSSKKFQRGRSMSAFLFDSCLILADEKEPAYHVKDKTYQAHTLIPLINVSSIRVDPMWSSLVRLTVAGKQPIEELGEISIEIEFSETAQIWIDTVNTCDPQHERNRILNFYQGRLQKTTGRRLSTDEAVRMILPKEMNRDTLPNESEGEREVLSSLDNSSTPRNFPQWISFGSSSLQTQKHNSSEKIKSRFREQSLTNIEFSSSSIFAKQNP